MLRAAGNASSISRVNTVCFVTLWTSTSGDAPDTVIVSSSAPTVMSAFTVAVKCRSTRCPPAYGAEAGQGKGDGVEPGLRLTMRYWPVPSVTAVRVFLDERRTGDLDRDAGQHAPLSSRTVPAIVCARAALAHPTTANAPTRTTDVSHGLAPSWVDRTGSGETSADLGIWNLEC